jgi:dephospho-CoA kinase
VTDGSSEGASVAVRPPRMHRIGLTGPIGCGKSTVAGWLGELGAVLIDADRVAREVTSPGRPAVSEIAATFGEDLIDEDGALDRAALWRIVFADPAALARLEAIVHPAVRPMIVAEMEGASRSGSPAVVLEAIKLVEGGLAGLCDEVWLITCSAGVQLARVHARSAARGTDPSEAEARIAAQSDLVAGLAPAATRILETSGGFEETRALVAEAYREALTRVAGGVRES